MAKCLRIAVIGDVHDCWDLEEDTKALRFLKPDLVLFTGDFGNENVDLVASVSNCDFPKAIILGNHGACDTHIFSSDGEDPVQLQLKFLGDEHVGYGRIDFPAFCLSIVGGRPFSCGGDYVYKPALLRDRYNIRDMDESAKRIYEVAVGAPVDHSLIFLAHNGPKGLGSRVYDICGRDWVSRGGDHGDLDLAKAIARVKETIESSIKLVVFGHMHKELAYGKGFRRMMVVGDDGITYLNGGIVPRVRPNAPNDEMSSRWVTSCSSTTQSSGGTIRAFTIVDMLDGNVEKVTETWVSVVGDDVEMDNEVVLFSNDDSETVRSFARLAVSES